MTDLILRKLLKAYQQGEVTESKLYHAIQQAGFAPVMEYEGCTCNPETRCSRRGNLCDRCGGQGWTKCWIIGWEYHRPEALQTNMNMGRHFDKIQ